MESYECPIFMGSIRNGSEGTPFYEHDVIEEIKYFQSMNLDLKIVVRITHTEFVFMHYQESGFEISAIKYLRFPHPDLKIKAWMVKLGKHLKEHFEQKSLSIMDNETVTYL